MGKTIVVCITIILCVCIIAAPAWLTDVFEINKVEETPEPEGAYEDLKVISSSNSDALLLDTNTGRLYLIDTEYGAIEDVKTAWINR